MNLDLRSLPIRRKLRIIILSACSVSLIIASGALFLAHSLLSGREYRRDIESLARIVAEMSAGAISYGQPEGTAQILAALKDKTSIVGARLVMKDGTVASQRGSIHPSLRLSEVKTDGFLTLGGELIHVSPVKVEGQREATLFLVTDYGDRAQQHHLQYSAILVGVLAVSFLVAIIVSARFERLIADPVQRLATVARTIAEKRDFSLRAEKAGKDEIGEFTDTFNVMLDEIQRSYQALHREIAERTRAEQELQRTTQQLADASRQAGMAEVATGVLHNVGNVLNSVNVSATLISEKLSSPRFANIAKAAHLLRENVATPGFLTSDERGRVLPGYLADAGEQLVRDREEVVGELSLLAKNIEHIKDIVSTQQNYARLAGLIEPMNLAALIEDALRMNATRFERHNIRLIREFSPVPDVAVDKHLILQILVNIIRNAKQSMQEASETERRLTITLHQKDEWFVTVAFADTGVGIEPENLTKIFSHGFTTRADGHGFGLHHAALAAQQMGGRIAAASEGAGRGALFTLELPVAPPKS